MLSHSEIKESIQQQGILPLYFHESEEVSIEVFKALYAAGIRVIEYTNRGGNALHNFKALKNLCASDYKDMVLGIGTIKTAAAAHSFFEAGADFIISPAWIDEVYDICTEQNYLWIPGCMTTSEIAKAEGKGITMVKLFPGSVLGPSYVSAIKEVFPEMKFMPTGGVSLDMQNLLAWFNAGVVAVGMGSKLVTKEILSHQNYTEITTRTKHAIDMIDDLRSAN